MQIPKLKLHWQILIALVLAVLFGYFMPEQVKYVSWFGDLFLRALNMIIIPLIFTSMISGITGMGNGKSLGRLGLKTISYYIVTSLAAILTGLVLVNLVRPGVGVDLGFASKVEGIPAGNQAISDLFLILL
ncbi:MAG: dicarboxylate/amino acid:cation symporter [Mangrovibacterium sp.]